MRKAIFAFMFLSILAFPFLIKAWYSMGLRDDAGSSSERKVLYYVDPMNGGFRSERPGIAPCGMPLKPVYADNEGQEHSAIALPPGTVRISPAVQQLIGVQVAPVEIRPATYTLRLYGKVISDETLTYRLNASTDSWIRELSDVTTGSIVDKGQKLAEALAPAYYNAQVTYLVALDNLDRIRRQLGGELRHQQADLADNQIRVAVQALQNLGITDAQIEELANTRRAQPYLQVRAPSRGVVVRRNVTLNQWFKAAEEFYTIVDISRVWVYADVYEDEAMHLRPGMSVNVKHAQLGKTFKARISRVLPLFDPVSKTLKVRIDVDNKLYELRPDMFVDVEIPVTMPPSLNVPADAIIDSGRKTIVYVDVGNGAFEPRSIQTGWRLGRQVEIISGLMQGEKVVVSGNFLIDSESRMRTIASTPGIEIIRDPVCGMTVDREAVTISKKTVSYAGDTYYFCSEHCVEIFRKEPEKYIKNGMDNENHKTQTAMPGTSHGWSEMVKSSGDGQHIVSGSSKSAYGREVVDWDGPEATGKGDKDWKGWGKFPGARYLGLQNESMKMPEGQQSASPADDDMSGHNEQESPVARKHSTEPNVETQEQSASGHPVSSGKQ